MKPWIKVIIYISIIPLLTVLYFLDNIRGYYRFKELCQQEKQLVITSKLERDVGWKINSNEPTARSYAFLLAGLPHVKFVRFRDWKDHDFYDVSYVGKAPKVADGGASKRGDWEKDYEVRPANLDSEVVYGWETFSETLSTETRMSRSGYRFTDLRSKKVVFSLTELGYSTFDRNHTLLDAPSGNLCGNTGKIWEQEIQSQIF
jgi:hypothetical protein